jgi:peptidoglycan/xylan/chitin deacetylase (PgdA/CDA1 family)
MITFKTKTPQLEIHNEFYAASIIQNVIDGNVEDVTIDTSKLNKDIIGEYPVIYQYNKEKVEIIVSVVDTQPPNFEIKDIEIDLGMKIEASQIVENVQDATNTKIRFKKTYNFTKVGDVNVTIVIEDECGNKKEKSAVIHILKKDEEAPKIEGVKNITICKGETNVDYLKNVTVSDNQDPSPNIIVNSEGVKVDILGDYEITYTVKDRSGNTAIATCIVSIIERNIIGSLEQSSEKVVYLTFDDGPSTYTQEVLDILDRYNAKATFFVTGLNPDYFYLIKDANDRGHTIGMHTFSHNYREVYNSIEAYYTDLQKIAMICEQQIGYIPHYIRFPGGSSNTISKRYGEGIMSYLASDVLTRGYQFYDWNVDSGDGNGTMIASDIVSYATASTATNIILLCHDANGKQTTIDALPTIIEHYQALGYRFMGLDDQSFAPHHIVNN